MRLSEIVRLRKIAEKAVSDMREESLKIAAFTVILDKLFEGSRAKGRQPRKTQASGRVEHARRSRLVSSLSRLTDVGFFEEARVVKDVKARLDARGVTMPSKNISRQLLRLVRSDSLEREGTRGKYRYRTKKRGGD